MTFDTNGHRHIHTTEMVAIAPGANTYYVL